MFSNKKEKQKKKYLHLIFLLVIIEKKDNLIRKDNMRTLRTTDRQKTLERVKKVRLVLLYGAKVCYKVSTNSEDRWTIPYNSEGEYVL